MDRVGGRGAPAGGRRAAGAEVDERYEDQGLIAIQHGVELRRVWDRSLSRRLWCQVPAEDVDRAAPVVAGLAHHARICALLAPQRGIPTILGLEQAPDGRPEVLVSPVDGIRLRDRIALAHRRHGSPMPSPVLVDLVEMLDRLAEVVEEAHEQGVTHGGLGPSAAWVDDRGQVWLDGWERAVGAGELGGEGSLRPGDWVAGAVPRDPGSTPPELALGRERYPDAASDVYGLGTVLYELLTGHPPYEAAEQAGVMAQICEGPPPEPDEVPETAAGTSADTWGTGGPPGTQPVPSAADALTLLCQAAMARYPLYRLASVEDFRRDLAAWLSHLGATSGGRSTVDGATPLLGEVPRATWSGEVGRVDGAAPVPATRWQLATAAPAVRYEELGVIWVGGMAEVRRVRDRAVDRVLAMKVMRPGLVGSTVAMKRVMGEARATALLDHPGVVPVHDVGWLDDGSPFFTMKEVRGRSLHQVLKECTPATPRGAGPRAPAHGPCAASWRPSPWSAGPWPMRTSAASSTGTSSRPTSWWGTSARPCSWTGASPWTSAPTASPTGSSWAPPPT